VKGEKAETEDGFICANLRYLREILSDCQAGRESQW
jgi:hypothetical protein